MVTETPLYPHCLRTFRSAERMVMNDKASLAFDDSNTTRHNEVETLEVIRQWRSLIIKRTHSCIFTCWYPSSQSSIGALPSRFEIAEASRVLESRIFPWCKDLVTKIFPNTFTMKLFPSFNQLNETLVRDWG